MRKLTTNKLFSILGIGILIFGAVLLFFGELEASKVKVNSTNSQYFKKQGYFIFKDNPRLMYKDYDIVAETIEYYEDDQKAYFTGKVVVIQGENKITADKLVADLNTDEFVFENQVNIYYVRKERNKDTKEDNAGKASENVDIIEIVAEHVIYTSGDEDHLIATGNVVMDVKDDNISADYLEYIGIEDKVIARDNVIVLGKDDEKIICDKFIYLLEGENEGFVADGNVVLEFIIKDKKEPDTPQEDK